MSNTVMSRRLLEAIMSVWSRSTWRVPNDRKDLRTRQAASGGPALAKTGKPTPDGKRRGLRAVLKGPTIDCMLTKARPSHKCAYNRWRPPVPWREITIRGSRQEVEEIIRHRAYSVRQYAHNVDPMRCQATSDANRRLGHKVKLYNLNPGTIIPGGRIHMGVPFNRTRFG